MLHMFRSVHYTFDFSETQESKCEAFHSGTKIVLLRSELTPRSVASCRGGELVQTVRSTAGSSLDPFQTQGHDAGSSRNPPVIYDLRSHSMHFWGGGFDSWTLGSVYENEIIKYGCD